MRAKVLTPKLSICRFLYTREYCIPARLRCALIYLRDLFVTALLNGYNRRVDVSTLSRSENFHEFSHTRNAMSLSAIRRCAKAHIKRYPHTRNIRCDSASGSTDWYQRYRTRVYPIAFVTERDFQRSFAERYDAPSPLCWLIGLASNARWFFIPVNVVRRA